MDPNEALERAAKFTAAATPENTESARARMAFVGFLYLAACGIERERDAIALSQPDEAKLRNDTLVPGFRRGARATGACALTSSRAGLTRRTTAPRARAGTSASNTGAAATRRSS
mgnify:CR=1 FL=1